MTDSTRLAASILRRVLGYLVLYLAAFAVFYLFGLQDSFVRPLIPLAIGIGIDYWQSRKVRTAARS
jgi:hypothetical protein